MYREQALQGRTLHCPGKEGLFHLSYHTERASGRLNAKEVCGCMLPLLIKYIPVALLHPPVPVGMGDAVRK